MVTPKAVANRDFMLNKLASGAYPNLVLTMPEAYIDGHCYQTGLNKACQGHTLWLILAQHQ